MSRRPNLRLTREDRQAVSRWWRFMLPAVLILVLTLLGAERAYQTLWPTAPSMQTTDETFPAARHIELSQVRRAR